VAGPFSHRSFGVLLHPSSLPGRELIGTLGTPAYRFVDWLAETGAQTWQILPLTMNGKDDSPYFSSSAFAGNQWLIDLEDLRDAGLLHAQAVAAVLHDHEHGAWVPFDELYRRKRPLLLEAADVFLADPAHPWRAEYDGFVDRADWLADTCLFFVLRDHYGVPWQEWPAKLRRFRPKAVKAARHEHVTAIERTQVIQFFFDRQWRAVRTAAAERGITIFGDLPIYVSPDSADVWAHQEQFHLDDQGQLTVQSGVPPDYFSETGQLWGNPLYRWDTMADDGYAWWLARLRRCLELTDLVRIDHFRALTAYWEVAANAPDAIDGHWQLGPGQHFLHAVRAEFPDFPFVAEDLGTLDDDVFQLRDGNGLPGMRVLQFGFDGTPDNPHLPDAYPEECIAYTGTHDNLPISAWWATLSEHDRDLVGGYYQHGAGADDGRATWSFIEAAIGSRAVAAVVPMQDLLVLDERARMNDPSTAEGNWGWRMPADGASPGLARALRTLVERYDRAGPADVS
jgi:4-alpha-glucanotransferase